MNLNMDTSLNDKFASNPISWLPIIALGVDLFTPYLIWKNIIPAEVRWVSHLAIALMMVVVFIRMLGFNRILPIVWMALAITALWTYVAIGNGQGIVPTLWGMWLFFQFPLVAMFIYLQPDLPRQFPGMFRSFCMIVLAIDVVFQGLQFVSGVQPGDSLSGLFGKNGTGHLVLFNLLVCCIYFGHWLNTRQWTGLAVALSLSMFSSVLGEMKIFAAAISLIGGGALFLYAVKYRAPAKTLVFFTMLSIVLVSFFSFYNTLVPGADKHPLQTYIESPQKLLDYLNHTSRFNRDGGTYSDIGRLDAVKIGWNSIAKDPVTFLFGYGLGTRSESQSLGTAGVALISGGMGLSVGTSLLVMMQEMGSIGLTLLVIFWLWLLLALWRDIQRYSDLQATGLRYGLLLFSLCWPIWLWYATSWTSRVPMLMYWISLGYVFAENNLGHMKILFHTTQVPREA